MDNFLLFFVIGFIGAFVGGLCVCVKMQRQQIAELKRELKELKK